MIQTAHQSVARNPQRLRFHTSAQNPMLHHLGITLQIGAMTFLPLLIIYQLNFGFRLIVMPACTIVGIVAFALGTWLREKK